MALPTETSQDIKDEVHATAFVVAGANKLAMVNDFKEVVQKALDNGESAASFQRRFDQIVAHHGWSYKGKRGWRSNLIYRVNVRSAYAAQHWKNFQDTRDELPYLKWITAKDERVRAAHRYLHGKVFHIDDPFLRTNYAPNGYNCRCTMVAISESEAKKIGIQTGIKDTQRDEGFAG